MCGIRIACVSERMMCESAAHSQAHHHGPHTRLAIHLRLQRGRLCELPAPERALLIPALHTAAQQAAQSRKGSVWMQCETSVHSMECAQHGECAEDSAAQRVAAHKAAAQRAAAHQSGLSE